MSKNLVDEYEKIGDRIIVHNGHVDKLGHLYDIDYNDSNSYYQDLITHTNTRVLFDPNLAVGGQALIKNVPIGKVQLNTIRGFGLKPYHSLLDFGCGTLRGGEYFIRYLDKNKYTGIDIADETVKYAKNWIETDKLFRKKNPIVIQNDLNRLIPGDEKYDFIVSLWVTYDMPPDIFEKFLHEAIDHMHEDSVFVFSYIKRDRSYVATNRLFNWLHDYRIIDRVMEERGAEAWEVGEGLDVANNQTLVAVELKE